MKLKVLALAMFMSLGLVGCNYDLVDTTFAFDRAIINLTNGEVITINVKSWRDYEDGDQVQITADDGTTYLVHSSNCTLIKD